MAVGHLDCKGGDAYDDLDRNFYILSGFDRNCFLVQRQVTSNEKAALQ